MRKLTALIWLIMALLTASALAVDTEAAPPLWPACDPETGL